MQEKEMRYTTKEFSELIGIKVPTLYKWEKDFDLTIPRAKNNERYYTEKEKHIFEKIKALRDKKFSIQNIKEYLVKDIDAMAQEEEAINNVPMQYLNGEEIKEILASNMQSIMKEVATSFQEELKRTKDEIKAEVREEIRNEFRHQQEQIQAENQKLMEYIASTKEEERKGFWGRLFGK